MANKYRAIDMIADFLTTIFILAIGAFIFYFFILGNRLELAEKIVKAMMPLSFFSLIFLVKIKTNKHKKRKLQKEANDNIVVCYLTDRNIRKDLAIIIVSSLIILLLALFSKPFTIVDVYQFVVCISILLFWHFIKFRKPKDSYETPSLNRIDILKDELILTSLPVILLIIAIATIGVDLIDILQSFISPLIMYVWHKILINSSK